MSAMVFRPPCVNPFSCKQWHVLCKLGQNHGCWYPGSLTVMMSWHGNSFCVTGPLWGESTSYRSPLTKGQYHRTLMFSLMTASTNCWINNWAAGDFTHCDTHMTSPSHQQTWYWLYRINRSIFFSQGSISTTCVTSLSRNDRECKYIFMFPQINLAWQVYTIKSLI